MTPPALRIRISMLVFVCALGAYAAQGPGAARAAGGSLLRPVVGASITGADQAMRDPGVVRARYVEVDLSLLRGRDERVMLREPAITLELFPDVTLFAEFERYDPSPSGVIWVGRIEGMPFSSVTLAYGRGLLTGSITTGARTYHVHPVATERSVGRRDGPVLHVVTEVAQEALPREAPPIEVRFSEAQLAEQADLPMADTGGVIDVMVVYTALAASHAGGASAILNLINLAVSEANTSYANSGITQRLRLVHAVQVPYTESSNFSVNLTDLRAGNGGLADVALLRNAYGADLVGMLVHPPSPSACGIAYLMTQVTTAFAPSGYSVTDTACVAGYTFAHELGHNMGARHDWYVDSGTTPYSYAHGYVDPTPGQRWRTIMAYVDLCSDQGFNCPRVLAWANPDRKYLPACESGRFNCSLLQYWYYPGAAMGVPGGTATNCQMGNRTNYGCDADDRRTLNNTAFTVANFRQAVR